MGDLWKAAEEGEFGDELDVLVDQADVINSHSYPLMGWCRSSGKIETPYYLQSTAVPACSPLKTLR